MRKTMRKNTLTFGRVVALKAWGHSEPHKSFNLNMEPSQVAILAALCQAAVQDHYSYDRRDASARDAPIQLFINYGDDNPGIVVKRERKRQA